jgi:hypothetical protein
VFQRKFDTHKDQWNFALDETSISSEWVLALDADYLLTDECVDELRRLEPDDKVSGYRIPFIYCVNGKRLRGSAYPATVVLYRRERARYHQDGHTQRVAVSGEVRELAQPILHDDHKSLDHWLRSQSRYARLEARKLMDRNARDLSLFDRIRMLRIAAPILILFYCLFIKRGILDGRAGLFYAFQRMTAELLLSLYLIENSIIGRNTKRKSVREQETGALLPIENRK